MNKLIALLLLALCACGADYQDGTDDANGTEGINQSNTVGSITEAMSGKQQFGCLGDGHGFNASAPCPATLAASGVCYLPASKSIRVWVDNSNCSGSTCVPFGPWDTALKRAAQILNGDRDSFDSGFYFSVIYNFDPGVALSINLNKHISTATGNNVEGYYQLSPYNTSQLTESLPGAYWSTSWSTAAIDDAAVVANGCSGTCEAAQRLHIAGALLARVAGIGYQTDTTTDLSSRAMTVAAKIGGVTTKDGCKMKAFNPASPNSWTQTGFCL